LIAPVLVLALSQGAPTTAADAKADDPWPAILRCRSELAGVPAGDTARFQQAYECGSQAGRLAWSGSSEDRSRLWEVYDGLPSGGVMAKKLLEGFMTARLAEIVGRLEPARSPAPEVRSLEEARRLHASVERGYQEALKALQTGSPYGFQTRRELAEAAVELLRGRASPERTVERVGRLSPNPFSCLRTSIRDDPQAVVLMLAYLEQGRYDLAAGALLRF
jgi:hypothetical protein